MTHRCGVFVVTVVLTVLIAHAAHAQQFSRLREDFGKTAGAELYQLPVIEEAPRIIRGMITSGMKKGVPEAERANFIPVLHNEADLKKLVSYKPEDDAYIVVLDRSGQVAYQTHGGPDAAGYAELKAKLQNLLKK